MINNELSNENPERKTINPIGLMFIAIIPIVGPIIWSSQVTTSKKYTVQKYAFPISLKTSIIKILYILGTIEGVVFCIDGTIAYFLSLFIKLYFMKNIFVSYGCLN